MTLSFAHKGHQGLNRSDVPDSEQREARRLRALGRRRPHSLKNTSDMAAS